MQAPWSVQNANIISGESIWNSRITGKEHGEKVNHFFSMFLEKPAQKIQPCFSIKMSIEMISWCFFSGSVPVHNTGLDARITGRHAVRRQEGGKESSIGLSSPENCRE